jgi:DNA-binding CsgD family transcriptional regulator/tetratricopeptide (TPR) repeat protein
MLSGGDNAIGQQRRMVLRGRERECARLDRVLAAVRTGESRVLVLRGDAGVGKSALLDYAMKAAPDLRILRTVGVESEMELDFAALHQLCTPLLDGMRGLPPPQRSALETVFGQKAGGAPDPFLIGLAVLTLLSDVSEKQSLLCVVDDAQFMDRASAQVLGFVARRLWAEPVAVLFATREPTQELTGLAEFEVVGLSDADAQLLLAPTFRYVRDKNTRNRIIAEARGNPLALLEFPQGLSSAELADRGERRAEGPLSKHLQDSFSARVEELPAEARLLLLLAAAEPLGDAALLWRAAQQLDIDVDIASTVDVKTLLTIDDRVTFRHPLVRSAVYRGATMTDKRKVHLALSSVTDERVDPDRRAWHLASAAVAPDESVAEELERSAARAQARGGLAAAASLLRRSVALTENTPLRAGRALTAARLSLHAGDFDAALRMVTSAEKEATEEIQQARAGVLRGQIAFASGHGHAAIRDLLSAASRLRAIDPKLARETYLEAWGAAAFSGESDEDTSLLTVSAAAASLPPAQDPGPADILLEGLATLMTTGRVAAAPALRRAMAAFASPDISIEDTLRWGWLMGVPPSILWDDQERHAILMHQLELLRAAGALARVTLTLSALAMVLAWRGDFAGAASATAEVEAVVAVTDTQMAPFGDILVAALRGHEDEATTLFETAAPAGQGLAAQTTRWASAILFNGLGQYEHAFVAAQRASEEAPELFSSSWALPELIEAAVRTDNTAIAMHALGRLAEAADAAETDWVRGVEARSRALLSDIDVAERWYQEAVQRLRRTQLRPELARTHLLYGEWLRRQGRRVDAREQLRAAHAMFVSIGMEAFADRTARELSATGEKVRKRTTQSVVSVELTPQERQIALLVRDGLSNPEVGERLFLSPRTVEWHLRKVFAKLSISSRKELRAWLPDSGLTTVSR